MSLTDALVSNAPAEDGEGKGRQLRPPRPRAPLLIVLAGMWFGLCMTAYVIVVPGHPYQMQVLASLIKVPVLLTLTLAVAFVPLYIAARLLAADLPLRMLWTWATGSVATMAAALFPLGAVVALLGITRNYSAVVLCSYAAFAAAGAVGIRTFARAAQAMPRRRRRRALVAVWAISLALAGLQLGWSMRPFVGWTGQAFTLFRSQSMGPFDQIYWEIWNICHGGGAQFPSR